MNLRYAHAHWWSKIHYRYIIRKTLIKFPGHFANLSVVTIMYTSVANFIALRLTGVASATKNIYILILYY